MVAMMGEPMTVRGVLGKHYGERAEVDNAVVVHECRDGIGIVDTTAMQIGMDRRIEVHGTQGTLLHEPTWLEQAARLLGSGDRGVSGRRVAGRGA